jgi:hypothetical protein
MFVAALRCRFPEAFNFMKESARQLALYRVAVEKLLPAKLAKIKSRQEAPQSIFSGWVDIFYPPNFACLGRKESFSTATRDYTH